MNTIFFILSICIGVFTTKPSIDVALYKLGNVQPPQILGMQIEEEYDDINVFFVLNSQTNTINNRIYFYKNNVPIDYIDIDIYNTNKIGIFKNKIEIWDKEYQKVETLTKKFIKYEKIMLHRLIYSKSEITIWNVWVYQTEWMKLVDRKWTIEWEKTMGELKPIPPRTISEYEIANMITGNFKNEYYGF